MESPIDKIEFVASALWLNHHQSGQTWNGYKEKHPDMAKIYRDNARCAISAVEKCLIESDGVLLRT